MSWPCPDAPNVIQVHALGSEIYWLFGGLGWHLARLTDFVLKALGGSRPTQLMQMSHGCLYPIASRVSNKEHAAQHMILAPFTETHSPQYVGTWAVLLATTISTLMSFLPKTSLHSASQFLTTRSSARDQVSHAESKVLTERGGATETEFLGFGREAPHNYQYYHLLFHNISILSDSYTSK